MNLQKKNITLTKLVGVATKNHTPVCIWMTGLSGSGKSTIAQMLKNRLDLDGYNSYVLDGDGLRAGINSDLGFNDIDRKESVRRAAEIARLFLDAGLIVVVALISPFQTDRLFARSLFKNQEFFEVFIDASIEECIRRDTKGLYAKAISGELLNFTGISSGFETPESPDFQVYTETEAPEDSVDKLFKLLMRKVHD
ncbi:CysC Adenylylsulfate kinase and related kinases [Methylophilaceae bacterium]